MNSNHGRLARVLRSVTLTLALVLMPGGGALAATTITYEFSGTIALSNWSRHEWASRFRWLGLSSAPLSELSAKNAISSSSNPVRGDHSRGVSGCVEPRTFAAE